MFFTDKTIHKKIAHWEYLATPSRVMNFHYVNASTVDAGGKGLSERTGVRQEQLAWYLL